MKKYYLALVAISALFAENIPQPQIQEPIDEKVEVQPESYPYIGIGIGITTLLDSRISAAGLKSTFMTTELYLGYEFSIFKNLQDRIYLSLTPLNKLGW